MIHKFKINEEIYVVQGYKIVKCQIVRIVTTQTEKEETFVYVVTPLNLKDKGKEKSFSEAYIVKTLEEAKKSALINWKTTYDYVKKQLETLTEESYNQLSDEDK